MDSAGRGSNSAGPKVPHRFQRVETENASRHFDPSLTEPDVFIGVIKMVHYLFSARILIPSGRTDVTDSVAVDAKRILLRYGAPIGIMDDIDEKHRIEFARAVSRTPVADRGERLLDILVEHGYLDAAVAEETAKKYRKAKRRSRK